MSYNGLILHLSCENIIKVFIYLQLNEDDVYVVIISDNILLHIKVVIIIGWSFMLSVYGTLVVFVMTGFQAVYI